MTEGDTEGQLRRAVERLRGDDVSTWRGVRLLSHLDRDREVRRVLDDAPAPEEEVLDLLDETAAQGGRLGRMAEDVARSLGGTVDGAPPGDPDDADDGDADTGGDAPAGVTELLDMIDAGELEVDSVTLELLVSRTRDAGPDAVTGGPRRRLVEVLEAAESALSPDDVDLLERLREGGEADEGADRPAPGRGGAEQAAPNPSPEPSGGLDALLAMRDFGGHAAKLPLSGVVAIERGRGSDAEQFLAQLVYAPLLESRPVLLVEPEGVRLTGLDTLPKMAQFRETDLFRSPTLPGDAAEVTRLVERELNDMGSIGVHPATFIRLPAGDWGRSDLGEMATGLAGRTDLALVLEGDWSESAALSIDGSRIVIEEGGGGVVAVAQPRSEGQPAVRYRYEERDGVLMPSGKELAELEETRCEDCGTPVTDEGETPRCEDCEGDETADDSGHPLLSGDAEEDVEDEWEGRLI